MRQSDSLTPAVRFCSRLRPRPLQGRRAPAERVRGSGLLPGARRAALLRPGRASAPRDGADFYITKPFDAEEMLAVVRRFVRNGAD